MVKKSMKQSITNEKIMEVLLDMDERMATKDDLKKLTQRVAHVEKGMVTKSDFAEALKDYATKDDLEKFKEDILEEIRPITKAVDKDAVTIVDYGKRIVVLERRAGVVTK